MKVYNGFMDIKCNTANQFAFFRDTLPGGETFSGVANCPAGFLLPGGKCLEGENVKQRLD